MDDQQLPGMPPPWPLRVTRTGDGRAVAVHAGPVLLSAFGAADLEMRDLVICSLTEGSRFQGKTVAAAFGIQPSQVSRIRSRYREHGARGLVHQMGRPPILSPARLRQARLQAGQGLTHAEIGLRLGVSRSRISELIKQHGTLPTPDSLFEDGGTRAAGSGEQAARDGEGTAPGQHAGAVGGGEQDTGNAGCAGTGRGRRCWAGNPRNPPAGMGRVWARAGRWRGGSSRVRCLPVTGGDAVHAFTSRIDAQGLLRSRTGATKRPVLLPLGGLGRPGNSHVHPAVVDPRRADDGADQSYGLLPTPERLSPPRPCCCCGPGRAAPGELADGRDPPAPQRRLASPMLAIEPAESQVYLADDHLAEYTGHQAVALGRNPRRGKPAEGHDDTYTCDLPGRPSRSRPGNPQRFAPRCRPRWRRAPTPS